MPTFGPTSSRRLATCHPDLQAICAEAIKFAGEMRTVEIGRADFDQFHAKFVLQIARKRHFQLRIGEAEQRLARERVVIAGQRARGAGPALTLSPEPATSIHAGWRT